MTAARILRGRTLGFRDDPRLDGAVVTEADGAVAIGTDGRILWSGPFADLPESFLGGSVEHFPGKIIMPGFIDAHVHFPQHRMIAAPAKDLLEWLNRFAFEEEAQYSSEAFAAAAAERFLDKLISHGTTSALAFSSVHKGAADCLFKAAQGRGMCLTTGKTLMDRNAPDAVLDTAEDGARDSADLIGKWHGVDRLRYAITVRFAVTSTEAQLQAAGALYGDNPDCLMHSHISESAGEIEFVKQQFPWSRDYTDVYDRFGLLGGNTVLAHGIHLSERECQVLHDASAIVVHCPTSNNFLGSGLFDIDHLRAPERPVHVGLATDVAGGTSYSMLQTLGEAYKVAMLKGRKLTALDGFYLATLGNARGLGLDGEIGTLEAGAWADIVVLDPQATDVLAARDELSENLEDTLFALMMLGDDRAVRKVYIRGEMVHEKD
ncbi:MAG: guanine deaminase [Rhodospirillaceae bacterium]|jgi:guanine deaminase|nr:guanine deaminase [Rhodospirillaceae bacterium]MBT4490517.1 guanine deaminase [Rhodospirillaceae bacterium]MBT5194209.1 guanine deaminase [Rhodospirillaceae bacterium]MBT5894268.1 guanine deaminase [Rhodospirillaceae bacterium]MBT6427062.1 guanine deaminase [Rhodospirillaceae bacterium]